MRTLTIFLAVLALSAMGFAQQKVVVTSGGDIVLLKKGESAVQVAKQLNLAKQRAANGVSCGTTTSFGYDPSHYPCNLPFVGYHHDVWAQWFLSPSSGTIETLYVYTNDQNEMESGTAKVSIFRSNIYPGHGPGDGTYKPPRRSWGYYKKSNLSDEPGGSGITPFQNFATDTTWIPTNIASDSLIPTGGADAVESFDPLGPELWPLSGGGGFPHVFTINSPNAIVMGDAFVTPSVAKDDPIFITVEELGTHVTNNSNPATWCASNTGIPSPSRNWKFYEHSTSGNRGWHARSEASWMWWIVMNVTGDVPPDILTLDQLSHTVSTAPRVVNANIQDCNPGHPDSAGVASVTISYSINGAGYVTVPMASTGGTGYTATIPGSGIDTYVKYYVTTTDIKGNTTVAPQIIYRIVNIHNAYYAADTAATYSWVELSGNGTKIASSAYFNNRGTQGPATDDGTAGPIDMGDPFWLFGDTARYVWIGANGGISLRKAATDTSQINGSGGSFAGNWIIPTSVSSSPITDLPRNFIAPFSNDLSLAPSSADQPYAHGAIWYKKSGTQFIIEWDSAGVVSKLVPDTLYSFEVILDNANRSVTFQYKNVHGPLGLDTSALIGMQSDSLTRWILLNQLNNPPQLRPRNGKATQFVVSMSLAALDAWNMVSVPGNSPHYNKAFLFPTAISNAFAYTAGYVVTDPLARGSGYWLKFSGAQTIGIPSSPNTSVTATVAANWNMIGSVTSPVSTGTIVPGGGTAVSSPYFGYGLSGYFVASTIDPGRAYWVKCTGPGTLSISASSASPKAAAAADDLARLNSLRVQDAGGSSQTLYFGDAAKVSSPATQFELPPPPPEGVMDVRFASGRLAETHPANFTGELSYRIAVSSAAFPITISWSLKDGGENSYVLTYQAGKSEVRKSLLARGQVVIQQSVSGMVLRVTTGRGEIPASFALDQNYPNPFNPATEIHYALPVDAHVTLKIFNVTGQEIASVVDGDQAAGFHAISWNSRNQANEPIGSGVYFYRLVASGLNASGHTFDQVRKMILLK